MRTNGFYWVQRAGGEKEVGRWFETGYWLVTGTAVLLVDDSFAWIAAEAIAEPA